jgi:hypothetical protein
MLPQITSFTPTSGTAGTVVTIAGASLTQTTKVAFGCVSASFTVMDDGTVTATAPTGAHSGEKISITTAGGTVGECDNLRCDRVMH